MHFFGICDSKRHFFFVGFAPGSDIFCYVTSLYSHMHELEKHGCAMLIKVSEDNEHGAAALYSQQQAKKFGITFTYLRKISSKKIHD